jgi:hypothetical protein
VTDLELAASAERMAREPFYLAWLDRARSDTFAKLATAKTHEDLLRAQAWHQAVDDLVTAVRKGKI